MDFAELNDMALAYKFQTFKRMILHRIWGFVVVVVALVVPCAAINSILPIWVSSSYFKAGAVTFTFTGGSTDQNSTITYSSAMLNTTLKVPNLGITDLNYQIASGRVYLLIEAIKYTASFLTFNVKVNSSSYLSKLKLTYMALDNLFKPAFSMNYYFPNVNKVGPNLLYQANINFTASTGVTLNTSHENVLLPFLHYIDGTTRDGTFGINLNFGLLNGSFYTVLITSKSDMTLKYAGFSRMIFDKTAIEALGSDYFNYGIISAQKNNSTALATIIPPDIIPSNLFYGMHSFTITTGLSELKYESSYDVSSGSIGYNGLGNYVFQEMKFSYMHHKTRICPGSNPYYNISELLCYDQCAPGWYADNDTMTCKKCPYDCATCTSASGCTSCDSITDKRQLAANRCAALPGYYDDGSNPVAQPCSPPCLDCHTSATTCNTCVSGYYQNGLSCLNCNAAIPSCGSCLNSTYCSQCNGGGSGSTCTFCASNQFANSTGSCVSCSSAIVNCLSCSSNSQCTLCQNTFTLNANASCSCTETQFLEGGRCSSCSNSISFCSSCSDTMTCTSCASTFTLLSPTSCGCSSSNYLDQTKSECSPCTSVVPYCLGCSSAVCSVCMQTFIFSAGNCVCPAGTYPNSTTHTCESCSVLPQCLKCSGVSTCTSCAVGFKVNKTSGNCDVQPCKVDNCDTCLGSSTTICQSCYAGYSIGGSSLCEAFCGNYALDSSQECDDGNSVSGDGCSASCKQQVGFDCYTQYINSSSTYSQCFYTSNISFSRVWTRKFEGNNSLKFEFQLGQNIKQWETVNFTSILGIDQYDIVTNNTLGVTSNRIASYSTGYKPSSNRFWVIVNYFNRSMQKVALQFSLSPYSHHSYPAFSPPNNIEFNPPLIQLHMTVAANNNQHANSYSPQDYRIYEFTLRASYFVVGVALLGVATSLIFRAGKVIVFQMIAVVQMVYFSLAFLDSMSPAFSGMLPLRYIAGILTFRDVQSYLQEVNSPNSMKGIYMFLNFSNNFSWAALGLAGLIGLGAVLVLIFFIYDFLANPETVQSLKKSQKQRNGYLLHRLAFHFLGELSLSLIFFCLPVFSMSVFFEIAFTVGKFSFWSYAQALGIGLAVLAYFVALLKSDPPKDSSMVRLGQFISQFNCLGCFKTFKYCNFQMLQTVVVSGLVMGTLYANSRIFSAVCIILISMIDIVVVAVTKPYRYGFVSCSKGQENQTEVVFQKIELYKVYCKAQPSILRLDQPDLTQKSQINDNQQVFAQHFETKMNMVKSKHQGLVQEGQILNHTKLFLFNNNTRRIFNLTTIILVQFIFICSQIYSADITSSSYGPTIQNMLPLTIHLMLTLNAIYNYIMLALQIVNRKKESLGRVQAERDSNSLQLSKSLYTQTNKEKMKEEITEPYNDTNSSFVNNKDLYQVNKLIIKSNSTATSMYSLKRPQIVKGGKPVKRHRRNAANIYEITQID